MPGARLGQSLAEFVHGPAYEQRTFLTAFLHVCLKNKGQGARVFPFLASFTYHRNIIRC